MFKIVILAVLAVSVANGFFIPYTGYPLIYPAVRSVELKSATHEVPVVAPVPAVSYLQPGYRYGYGHQLPASHLRVDKTPLEHSYEFVSQGW